MIKPLTSLRFFFALMVFVSHLYFLEDSPDVFLQSLFNNYFKEGYIGVSFFFVLSGFILAYTYQNKFIDKSISSASFYIARVARIYPLHLLCFFIAIPLTYDIFTGDKMDWLQQAFTNITLTQTYIPVRAYYFSFNIPTWSISNEMFFYVLFPFLLPLLFKFSKSAFSSILFIIVLLAFPLLLMVVVPESYYHAIFYVNPIIRIFDFILGIFLYNIFIRVNQTNLKLNFTILELSAIVIFALFIILHPEIPQVLRFSLFYWIPMAGIVFIFAFQRGIVSKLLSNRHLILLGEISFGFYMIHHLVLRYFKFINSSFLHITNEYMKMGTILVVTIALSYASYVWFEKPVNAYIRKRFDKK